MQLQRGKQLPPVTESTIVSAVDSSVLTSAIYFKILEKAQRLYPVTRGIFNSYIEKAVKQFSPFLQGVYHTHLFECALSIGDIDKVFHYDGELEYNQLLTRLSDLRRAYELIHCPQMLAFLEKALQAKSYEQLQLLSDEYIAMEKEVSFCRLKFIQNNLQEFIIE